MNEEHEEIARIEPEFFARILEGGPFVLGAAVLVVASAVLFLAWLFFVALHRRSHRLLGICAFGLVIAGGLPACWFIARVTGPPYNVNSLAIPPGYTFEHQWGDDSYTGRITRIKDNHVITFDAGIGAGVAAHPSKRDQYEWWRELIIDSAPVWVDVRGKRENRRVLFVTFSAHRANFWTEVNSEADIAEALSIIFTYKAPGSLFAD